LIETLGRLGYADADIVRILGGNMECVFNEVFPSQEAVS